MQKESAQSDYPALRKRPKTDDMSDIQNMSTFGHIMDVFSPLSYSIELIPFAMSQASLDTSLEYHQHGFLRSSKIKFFNTLTIKNRHFYHP